MKHIQDFNTLRRNATIKPLDKALSSLQVLYQLVIFYLAQIILEHIGFKEKNSVTVLGGAV